MRPAAGRRAKPAKPSPVTWRSAPSTRTRPWLEDEHGHAVCAEPGYGEEDEDDPDDEEMQ
jgi:hypothetical protein